MNQNPVVPLACHLDFARRISVPVRRRTILVAAHLPGHPSLHLADALLADISAGRPLAGHLSPMKNQRRVFKRANRNGKWTDYRPVMDHLLNKWPFRHFHCGGSVPTRRWRLLRPAAAEGQSLRGTVPAALLEGDTAARPPGWPGLAGITLAVACLKPGDA